MLEKILNKIKPGAEWIINADKLEWLDTKQTEPTKKEIDDGLVRLVAQQELQQQIDDAKEYLDKTDHKFYNGYKPKEGEDLVEIERLRDEAREFIRANEGDE